MKNLLASWFNNILAFDETGPVKKEFSIVDPTAAQADGLNTVVLSVDPSDGTAPTIVSLYFDGTGVKLFEKKYQNDADAQSDMSAMAKDLEEAATLSKEQKTDEAKNLATELFDKYKRSSDPLTNEQPTPTMTQSSLNNNLEYKGFQLTKEGDGNWNGILTDRIAIRADSAASVKAKIDKMFHKAAGKTLKKEAGIVMQNVFFDNVEEAMDFQKQTKELQGPEGSAEGKPLWEQNGNGEQVAPSNETKVEEDNELAPPSLSFDRIEKDKAKSDKDIGKRIKDQVKTEVESALEEKSASVFGPDQEDLVEALRKNGRNWDEIKKIFVKDLSYNEDDTTVFLDGMRAKDEGGMPEGLPMPPKPPEDLVSPETHDKLIKEVTDKTEIKPEPKPLEDEIARADNAEIRKVAVLKEEWAVEYFPNTSDKMKVHKGFKSKAEADAWVKAENIHDRGTDVDVYKIASKKIAINPLQEPPAIGQNPGQPLSSPVQENPTFDAPVPESQTSAPEPEFLEAPHDGDRVYVMGDYETGEDGFEGTMGSEFKSKGDDFAVVYQDDGDSREVALHRVVKASQKKVAKAYYEKIAAAKCEVCEDIRSEEDPGREYDPTCVGYLCSKHEEEWNKNKDKKASQKKAGYGNDYSGYTNRSTWGLSLWLDNDQPMYDESRRLAEGARDADELSAMLRHRYSNVLEQKQEEGMSSKEVNWKEIAQNLIDETKENAEYEHSKSAPGVIESLPTMDIEKEKDILLDQLSKETDPAKKQQLEQKYKRLSMASLNSIKEAALKIQADLEHEGEIALYFRKEGIEKQASGDSAFEANGWCRVWIQEDEIASDSRYPAILKLPDENARIAALKDLARDLAHEALSLADSSASKVGVQSWFDSLNPSDHDRIDWVSLASPKSEEDEDAAFELEQFRKYGPEAVNKDFKDQIIPKSSQNSKIEKKADADHQHNWGRLVDPKNPDGDAYCVECNIKKSDFEKDASLKQAAEPLLGPTGEPLPAKPETPTTFKKNLKAPSGTEREKAQPATQEQAQLVKEVESSLSSLDAIKSMVAQAQAKLNAEIKAIEEAGGRVQIEGELKAKIDRLSKLVEATQNQMVYAGETMVRLVQETKDKPFKPNDAWKVQKLTEKFAGAQEYLDKAIAGAQSLATTEQVRDLVFFPRKTSKLSKKANFLETLDEVYNDIMAALKLIIGNEPKEPQAV